MLSRCHLGGGRAVLLPIITMLVGRGGQAAIIDPTTVGYCNLPNDNHIPPLKPELSTGLELVQVSL